MEMVENILREMEKEMFEKIEMEGKGEIMIEE